MTRVNNSDIGILRGPSRLKDIAAAAGVSVTLASKVINNTKSQTRVSPTMRKRVLQLAENMGYRPSAAARILAKKKTDVIGIIVSRLFHQLKEEICDISRILEKNRKHLMVLDLGYNSDVTFELPEMISEGRVDGVIVVEPHYQKAICNKIDEIHFPWVGLAAKYPEVIRPVNQIICETYSTIETPALELLQKGHRKLAYLHYDIPYEEEYCRHKGLDRALTNYADASILRVPCSTLLDDVDKDEVTEYLLKRLFPLNTPSADWPTGVLCDLDWMAVAVYEAAVRRGLNIPRDLSVCGFGNEIIGKILCPPLSTVMIDAADFYCVHMLLRLIETRTDQANIQCLPKYIERKSVGPAPSV